jgi:putative ABC transport system permease protein
VRFSSLTETDATELGNPFNVPDAKNVVPLLNLSRDVVYNGLTRRTPITATLPAYFGMRNRVLGLGRFFDQQDVASGGRVAVIGLAVLKALFQDANAALGETIRIGDVPFRVIGVLTKFGGSH